MRLFQQCKRDSVDYFGDLFEKSLDQIPQWLSDRIAASQNDVQRNRYLEARQCIDPQRPQLLNRFQRALQQAFDDFATGYDPEPDLETDPSHLALIDKAQYEDDVAIRTLATRAGAVNAEELWKLNRRFAVIRGGKKCLDELNPCGPQQLCEAMRETYRKLEIDPTVKLLLYKLYERQVLSECPQFYQRLNQHLASEGVLKNLSFNVASAGSRQAAAAGSQGVPAAAPPSSEAVAHSGEPAPATATGPGLASVADFANAAGVSNPAGTPAAAARPGAANDASHPATASLADTGDAGSSIVPLVSPEVERRQARVMDAIKAVQQKRRRTDGPRTTTMGGVSYGNIAVDGVAGQADTFTQRDIALALGVLQAAMHLPMSRQLEPRQVADTENRLMGELGTMGEKGDREKVTGVDADTIDLVGMLFDYMLDDPQLPDGFKSLLSHLHTPYLKVAVLDKEFFASARHPARILLDLMAAAGARWLQEGDDDEKVYQRIRLVVERIINEFDDDLAFFDELLKDFTRFVKLLEKRADLAAQRSVEAEKGLDQLSQAKDLADSEISRRIAGTDLPGPVRELLEQPWSDYLVFNYLRHGKDSDSWQSTLQVVDGIVASVQPLPAGDAQQCVEGAHDALNLEIERGLNSLGYDRDQGRRLLGALREAQQQVQRGQAPRLDEKKFASNKPAGGSAIARQLKQQRGGRARPGLLDKTQLSSQEKALADKLSSVSFGTWFEFKQGISGPNQRLKLSWYSSVSGNYMFVNHSGVKTVVKTLHQLLQGMNDGGIVMLERENRNFFERAISSVLGRLSKT